MPGTSAWHYQKEKMRKKIILIIIIALSISALALAYIYVYREYLRKQEKSTAAKTEETKIDSRKHILMFGRSVMEGWFIHWRSDTSTSVKKEGYTLEYRELTSPPEIVESFRRQINNLSTDEKPVIFFKFCFDDFQGGSKEEAEENLAENKKYIEEVYKISSQKGLRLIIGNALPRVSEYKTSYLKWNHREFNEWLFDFQTQHPDDIFIFDMYNQLTDSSGNLKAEFTNDPSDSHPNDAGYKALDEAFLAFLNDKIR